ncbi:MAG TPA: hypothetical protein GX724_01455 [Fibrobacter sp.]|nr:hypothetical protein [Fibrobacter sp.]
MILGTRGREIVQGTLDCHLLTFEIQTPFGEELEHLQVLQYIQKELPLSYKRAQNRISFLPLISFNSAAGRLHRFLVAFLSRDFLSDRFYCDRVLPLAIAFTALAEKEMHACEGYENMIYCGFLKNRLHLLVFMEGKLVHWVDEKATEVSTDLNQRIHRLRLFLKQDPLLSRLENSPLSIYSNEEIQRHFEGALKDPMWRFWDLDASTQVKWRRLKQLQKRVVFSSVIIVVFFFLVGVLDRSAFPLKSMGASEQERQQEWRSDSFFQKTRELHHQISTLPTPLDIGLILSEVAKASSRETRLESFRKTPSEKGVLLILDFSAGHFEEATAVQRRLKQSGPLEAREVLLGHVHSTPDGRVLFKIELLL